MRVGYARVPTRDQNLEMQTSIALRYGSKKRGRSPFWGRGEINPFALSKQNRRTVRLRVRGNEALGTLMLRKAVNFSPIFPTHPHVLDGLSGVACSPRLPAALPGRKLDRLWISAGLFPLR